MKSRGKKAFVFSTSQRLHLEAVVWQMLSRFSALKGRKAAEWHLSMRDLEECSDAELTMLAIDLRGHLMTHSKRKA